MCWVFSVAVTTGTPGLKEAPLFLSASVSPSVKESSSSGLSVMTGGMGTHS